MDGWMDGGSLSAIIVSNIFFLKKRMDPRRIENISRIVTTILLQILFIFLICFYVPKSITICNILICDYEYQDLDWDLDFNVSYWNCTVKMKYNGLLKHVIFTNNISIPDHSWLCKYGSKDVLYKPVSELVFTIIGSVTFMIMSSCWLIKEVKKLPGCKERTKIIKAFAYEFIIKETDYNTDSEDF